MVAHSADRKFDAEDLRLIESLGRFAGAFFPLLNALEAQEEQSQSLRVINERLVVSSVRQHELTEKAQEAEAALRASEELLAGELSATRQLQSVGALLIEGGFAADALYEKILEAGVAILAFRHGQHADIGRGAGRAADAGLAGIRPGVRQDLPVKLRRTLRHLAAPRDEQAIAWWCLTWRTVTSLSARTALENHRKMGIRAVQSTPLFSRTGRLLGVLSTHWHTPHTPQDGDLRLFDILARQTADLIERMQSEEARGRLVALVGSSDDAIISKDLNGIIRTWNAGAERLFGYTAEEAVGRPVAMLIPPDHADEEPSILDRIRRGGAHRTL